jgi:hypothetical protein
MQKRFFVDAKTLPDSWFQLVYGILEHGREFKIDEGSFAGHSRLEFDWVDVHIERPHLRDSDGLPLLPEMPETCDIPAPTDKSRIANYASQYIMGHEVSENESYCYDEETEVLTSEGWMKFKDYCDKYGSLFYAKFENEDEDEVDKKYYPKVATLNPNTNVLEWQYPVGYNKMMYNGDVYHFKSKQIDVCVTPNHTMYVAKVNPHKNDYPFELIKANEMKHYRYKFKKDCEWVGEEKEFFVLPKVEYNNSRYNGYGEERKIPMDLWLRFFGYWIADGSIRRYKNKFSYDIVITKHENTKGRKEIIKTIEKIFENVTICGKDIVVNDKQIWTYLEKFGKAGDKFIPKEIMNLSSRQLKILFDCMYICDGDKKDDMEYSIYSTTFFYISR